MCGIFGFVSSRIERPGEFHKFATRLFIEAEGRGRDASGFAALTGGTTLVTDKRPYMASFFTKISQEWRNLRKSRKIGLIGHTRAATCGDPKVNSNNHPFHGPRYVIAHNGWVSSHDVIARINNIELGTDCDSELILHFLESKPTIRDGIIAVFDHLDDVAVMAVCVLDKATGNVHLFRNTGSPCVLIKFPRWNAHVFASTPRLIVDAATNIVDKWGEVSEHAKLIFGSDIPAFSDVCIRPNGKIEVTNLSDGLNVVKYTRKSASSSNWTNSGSLFAGMSQEAMNRILAHTMSDTKDVPTPYTSYSETDHDGWGCAQCGRPLTQCRSAFPDPQNRSETSGYVCDTCYRTCIKDTLPIPATAEDETTSAKKKVLSLIVPTSLLASENPLDTIHSWREPLLDHELDDADQGTYMRLLNLSTERKIDLWTGMDYRRIIELDDAEYLAYTDFLRNCMVTV